MPESVRLELYGPDEALHLKEPMLSVYLSSHADQQHDPWYEPAQFWRRLVDLYAPSRDFALVAAWQGDTMVGYAFGSPKAEVAELWRMAGRALPDIPQPTTSEPIYFFREFAVRPEHQGKGHGRSLHNALLKTRSERLAHLLVRQDNPVQHTYRHWGWHVAGVIQPDRKSVV